MTRSRYEEWLPAPDLRQTVLCHWRFECDPGTQPFVHHIWPDGCVSVVTFQEQTTIVGPTLRARVIELREPVRFEGIRFWPDTGAAIVGIPAAELRDRRVPVDRDPDIRTVPIDPRVRRAIETIVERRGDISIAALAAAAGCSARQLQRSFRARVGLTPKEFARVRRVRSVIAAILGGQSTWAGVAVEFGYADQAHLARDLSDLTGFPPQAVQARLESIEHDNVTP